jgi:DNA-binding PadR family transcriptional regulator
MKQSGTLELTVLGLLKERSMHGYELRKQLGAMLGPLWLVSWGSLYPTLRRLARSGAIEAQTETRRRAAKSAKGSKSGLGGGGRRRTVYSITQRGEDRFRRMLEETAPATDGEHFTARLAFFRYIGPEARLALLERRRAYLQEKLAEFRSNLRTYRERMDAYALSLQNHDMAVTESDIEWIDELITREIGPDPSLRRTMRGQEGSRPKRPRVQQGLDS